MRTHAEAERSEVSPRAAARDPALDMIRGLCVMLVVAFHCHLYLAARVAEPASLSALNEWLSGIRMPVLFLISGLLASGVRTAAWSKVSRRIATTTWLFLVWAPVFMLVCRLHDPVRMLIEPRGEIWFVWALSILTALLYATRRIDRRLVMLAVLAISVPVFFAKVVLPGYTQMFLGRYSMFFFAGALFRAELGAVLRLGPAAAGALAAAAGLLAWVHWSPLAPVEYLLLGLALLAGASHAHRLAPRLAEPLARLGRRTLPVYLLHSLLIRVIKQCLWHPVASPAASAVLLVALVPVVIGACLALHRGMPAPARFLFALPRLDAPAAWLAAARYAVTARRSRQALAAAR